MSKDVQSATLRGAVACGDSAEELQSQALQCLLSASAVLRMYWQDPECEADTWREGGLVDGSDEPTPMDANAIEGVGLLVDLAYSKLMGLLAVPCAGSIDIHSTRDVLVPAVDILRRPRQVDAASLTPAMAFAISGLLDQAAERLDQIKLPGAGLREAA